MSLTHCITVHSISLLYPEGERLAQVYLCEPLIRGLGRGIKYTEGKALYKLSRVISTPVSCYKINKFDKFTYPVFPVDNKDSSASVRYNLVVPDQLAN